MNQDQLTPSERLSFEDIKQANEHGAEYWSGRDMQALLGYSQWRRFVDAIHRAITSCEQSGNPADHHFARARKPATTGADAKKGAREVDDYHLSRFACYLIAQNGDPRKPEIAQAQRYFAVQTHRQELNDKLAADLERLELRKQTGEEFKALSGAARQAGVNGKMFGVFHDAGYKGLYGGWGTDTIKSRKKIPANEQLIDRMNSSELAANQFRMTQTRDKLARDKVRDQAQAIQTHEQVAKEVRAAIIRIGGTLPEKIPPAEHIREVEKRVKEATPKLELDERDAGGLLGDDAAEAEKQEGESSDDSGNGERLDGSENSDSVQIDWIEVESEAISRFAYDDECKTLSVVFASGASYVYFDVPQSVYDGLSDASSKGRYVSDNIRDVYRFERGDDSAS